MIEIVERKYFTNGSPVDSVVALSANAFRAVGEIIVMCILQGEDNGIDALDSIGYRSPSVRTVSSAKEVIR